MKLNKIAKIYEKTFEKGFLKHTVVTKEVHQNFLIVIDIANWNLYCIERKEADIYL